jgi:NADH dehydrogenase (ubiquinone) 1 beta subcomplex subunit 10
MVFKEDYPKFDETAPDDFDPAKPYADPVAFIEQREHLVREKFVEIEKAKILRERLQQCYWREGVNHVFKCRPLVKKYMDSLKNLNWGKDNRPHYLKE